MTPASEQAKRWVSVVIPAYNAAGFIRRAMDSVLAQTWPHREIIVVNDGSTDDTLRELATYRDEIRIIDKPNGGLPAARNSGIHAATGAYIAFLDADDRWLPEKLTRQVETLEADPDIGFCSTVTLVEDPQGSPNGEWPCPRSKESLLKTLFLQNGAIPGSGSGVMVRRELFQRVGLFDPTLRSLEDIDMWMRLAAASRYTCIDEALTIIVKHPDSMSRNLDAMRASALQVMKKNRELLPQADRGGLWRAGYANVMADYAKWEYRSGQRTRAIAHLVDALGHSPIRRGRMLAGLLLAMALGRPL